MNNSKASSLLGVEDGAPAPYIEAAYVKKTQIIAAKLQSAPTEVLKKKFADLHAELELARTVLLESAPPSGAAASAVPASPAGDSSTPPNAAGTPAFSTGTPLTATKMADLPNAGPLGGEDERQLLSPGQLLVNRYEVQEQIGAGGMGAVYRATDRNTGQPLALKVLLPSLTRNERARERFLDEARISQKLSHPNIVNVYDVQQDGDLYFLTMELLEGQDLRQVMENRRLAHQQFTTKELLDLADQLCSALGYAHKYTVHRDLKPENVWLDDDGTYKLMDFGIAQLQSTSQRTQTGAAMGTAYYMAPEQLRGQKNIDGRADLYALAVLLYELASGDVPAGVIKPLREKCPSLPKGFAAAVMQCLQADPEERYDSADALAVAVKRKGGGSSMPQLPWKYVSIAAALLMLVGGIGFVTTSATEFDLRSLLPMSKEEKSLRRATIARIQGEINVLKERLNTARSTLNSDLRDARRNNSSNLASLQYWQEITEDFIFNGAEIPTQEGNLSMAEALLQDEAYAQAETMFNEVRKSYKELSASFEAGERLHDAKVEHDKAKEQWEQLNIVSATPHPDVVLAEAAEQQAHEALAVGDMADALAHWRRATESWGLAHEDGVVILEAREGADKAKGSWLALKSRYRLSDPKEVAEANRMSSLGQSQFKAGEFPAAVASWEQAISLWGEAKAARGSEVAKIDAAERKRITAENARRAAEEEAKRKEEEHQALVRQKEREIDSLYDSLKSSVQSNGHYEKKRSEVCYVDFQANRRWCEHEWHVVSLKQSLDREGQCEMTIYKDGHWGREQSIKLFPKGKYTVDTYTERVLRGMGGGASYDKAEFNLHWYILKLDQLDVGGGRGTIMFETQRAANEAMAVVSKIADACAFLRSP